MVFIVGLFQISQTAFVQSLIKVNKLVTVQEPVKTKEPDLLPIEQNKPKPEASRKPPTSQEQKQESKPEFEPPPFGVVVPEAEFQETESPDPVGNDFEGTRADPGRFVIGKSGGRFTGYESLLTASIRAVYEQPADLQHADFAVTCELILDEDGQILAYKLINSSGNTVFDRSTLAALSKLHQVRPPPVGMARTIIVKFFSP